MPGQLLEQRPALKRSIDDNPYVMIRSGREQALFGFPVDDVVRELNAVDGLCPDQSLHVIMTAPVRGRQSNITNAAFFFSARSSTDGES